MLERRTKRYHRMTTSTYDVHNVCNLRCEGCSYFVTDRPHKASEPSADDYDSFFAEEAARGVTYPIFSGAEPSLNQRPLHIAARHWRYGAVFTNGIKPIDRGLPFRVVISLWSGRDGARKLRGANAYDKALSTAQGDHRAIVFYTITRHSVEDITEVVADCAARGIRISFNFFSMTTEYRKRLLLDAANDDLFYRFSTAEDNLTLGAAARSQAIALIESAMDRFPDTVLFSRSLGRLMAQPGGIHAIDPATGMALDCAVLDAQTHRSFNYDLTRDDRKDCCAPDLDCSDCRVLGAALATLITRKAQELGRSRTAGAELTGMRDLMMQLYYWDWVPTHAGA